MIIKQVEEHRDEIHFCHSSEKLVIIKIMDNFRVHYSGSCFERGDSLGQVERRVHDKIGILGQVFHIEARLLHPDEKEYSDGNYVVSFEGEIEVQAETQVKAENQAYDHLSHLGQITVVAFKKQGE